MKYLMVADIHLSDFPPRCRATEKDWAQTQLEVIKQVQDIATKHLVDCIIVCGDLFHKPQVSPKLEALLITSLMKYPNGCPFWCAIPGQHDIIGHSLDTLENTSFNVLKQAKVLDHLTDSRFVCAIPFGKSLAEHLLSTSYEISVAHEFLWEIEPYPGAPKQGNVDTLDKAVRGTSCKLLFTGDNHIPFEYNGKNITIINCGALIRRTADQENHRPSVILVEEGRQKCSLGSPKAPMCLRWERIYLDTSQDKFVIPESFQRKTQEEKQAEMSAFIDSLTDMSIGKVLSLDHVLAEVYAQRNTDKATRQLIQEVRSNLQ